MRSATSPVWSPVAAFGTAPEQGWDGAEPIWAGKGETPTDWAFLRTEFDVPSDLAWATLFLTGSSAEQGRQFVYKAWLNGRFVGLGSLRSTADETRFDGFDVTDALVMGRNALGVLAHTTTDHRFLALLQVGAHDGTVVAFRSDAESWRAQSGDGAYPPRGSIGTSYYTAPVEDLDAAAFPSGFDRPAFDDSDWSPPLVRRPYDHLVPTPTVKVALTGEPPRAVVEETAGRYLLDFGTTRLGGLRLGGPQWAGRTVELRFGEVLDEEGHVQDHLATGNTYRESWTLDDEVHETWGWRSFRYAEVAGAPPGLTSGFDAVHHAPAVAEPGAFESSDPTLDAV